MGLPKRSLSFSAQRPAKVSIKSTNEQRMSLVASPTIAEESESEAGIDTPTVLEAFLSKEGGWVH